MIPIIKDDFLNNFYSLESLKRLSQKDRTIYSHALKVFSEKEEPINLEQRNKITKVFENLSAKSVPEKKPKVVHLFTSMFKGILNFFNLRLPSHQLLEQGWDVLLNSTAFTIDEKIDHIQQVLVDKKQPVPVKQLGQFFDKLSHSVETDWKDNHLNIVLVDRLIKRLEGVDIVQNQGVIDLINKIKSIRHGLIKTFNQKSPEELKEYLNDLVPNEDRVYLANLALPADQDVKLDKATALLDNIGDFITHLDLAPFSEKLKDSQGIEEFLTNLNTRCPNLVELRFPKSEFLGQFSSKNLSPLSNFKNLVVLDLGFFPITDFDFFDKSNNIKELGLHSKNFNPDKWNFENLPHLEKLDLSGSILDDEKLLKICDLLNNRLKNLVLKGCAGMWSKALTPKDLAAIDRLHNLEELDLSDTNAELPGLKKLSHLKVLRTNYRVYGFFSTTSDIQKIAGVKNLTELDLSGSTILIDEDIEQISRLPYLTRLDLKNCKYLSDHSLKFIIRLPQLKYLDMRGCIAVDKNELEKVQKTLKLRSWLTGGPKAYSNFIFLAK